MKDNSAKSEKGLLHEFEYEPGDYFQSMEGTFWVVEERVYNFDATENAYGRDGKYEITEEWDRRQYVMTRLVYDEMCCETDQFSEHELIAYFDEATENEARKDIERQKGATA